jgi:Amt family ammonium transporter
MLKQSPVKFRLGVDDSFDLFAQHAIDENLGLLMNAFFASHSVITLDGVSTNAGGWVDHNWKQLYIQIAYILATCSYMCILIARVINMITGLHLRVRTEDEILGLDEVEVGLDTLLNFRDLTRVQIGEFANDYIEVCRDVMEPEAVQMGRRELTLDVTVVAG